MKVFKMGMIGLIAVGLLLAASAQGAVITVNWAAAGAAIEANNAPLTMGDLVQVGYMTGTANLADFTPWASGVVGDSFSLPGVFSESSTLDEAGVSHKQIYMVCYGNTVADAANYGIFTGVSDPNWVFPASSDSINLVAIDLGDASVQIIAGSTGVNDDVFGDGSYVIPGKNILGIDTQAVPEPSSIMLVGVGLLGMVGLIRRRS